MSTVYVMVVFFGIVGVDTTASVGRVVLGFPTKEQCEEYQRVPASFLRELYHGKPPARPDVGTVGSMCLAVIPPPRYCPPQIEREC
jgi:hypothetical protein